MTFNKDYKGDIIITETGTVISPYHPHQCMQLEKITSTYDSVRHIRNPVTGFCLEYEETESCFVTHLHNTIYLEGLLPGYQVKRIPSTRYKRFMDSYSLNPDITPREVQYEIIQDIISNEHKNQWFVYLSQGLGKTLLTVYLMTYFNMKTLIMCYNKDILEQWSKTILDKTNIDKSKVLFITSSTLLRRITFGDFPSHEYDIFMCTPGLLTSFGKKYGFRWLTVLIEKMGIGFKVFDEAHRNIANIIKINAFTSVEKTIYLSGDFGQSDSVKEKLYFNMFHNIPIIKPSDDLMSTLKFTVAIIMQYNSKPNELQQTSVYRRRGFSFYDYMKYQFSTDIFFNVLDYTLSEINKTNVNHYKILILVNMIEHVDQLYDTMSEKYSDIFTVGKYHSQVSDIDKEYCREHCDLIISTYQSFSTGIDVSLIKYVISCSVCTKIEDNQASGRARPLPDGSDAFYFMFADMGFPYTKKKLGGRLTYLQKTKIKDIKSIKYIE